MNQPDACQSCKKNFAPGDDVVICPHCGAPYHRECYQKEGQCVYTAKHAQGFEYMPAGGGGAKTPPADAPKQPGPAPAEAQSQTSGPQNAAWKSGNEGGGVVCQSCRTINEKSHIFCERCGHPLHAQPAANQGRAPGQPPPFMAGEFQRAYGYPGADMQGEFDGIEKKDWAAYIGSAVPTYFARMAQQDSRGSKISFTISAFFFSYLYFAYRKMWLWAVIAFAIQIVLSAPTFLLIFMGEGMTVFPGVSIESVAFVQNIFAYVTIVRNLFFGLFALQLYRKNAAKKMRQMKKDIVSAQDYQLALPKKGGVSVLGVVLVVAVLVVLNILLFMYGGEALTSYFYNTMGLLSS